MSDPRAGRMPISFTARGIGKPVTTALWTPCPRSQVALSPYAPLYGVLVAMNDSVHMARYVVKADSQLIGSFESHPGPVGQVRTLCKRL